jgi:hypothetical protein
MTDSPHDHFFGQECLWGKSGLYLQGNNDIHKIWISPVRFLLIFLAAPANLLEQFLPLFSFLKDDKLPLLGGEQLFFDEQIEECFAVEK